MRKKHMILLWMDGADFPAHTRCGKSIDTPKYMITSDTPKSEMCKSCVNYIDAAKRRRMYGKRGFRA